jgi:hypothetical protein
MKWENLDWEKYTNNVIMIYYYTLTPEIKLSLLNALLNRDDTSFFSLTSSHNETTLLVDEELANKFNLLNNNGNIEKYVCYQLINTGSFLDESGLVNMISAKLKKNEIPILYLTTSNSNFLLVPEEHVDVTDNLLIY